MEKKRESSTLDEYGVKEVLKIKIINLIQY